MKLYYTYNQKKCELIEKRGVSPLFFDGDRTYYKWCNKINEALDEYEVLQIFYEGRKKR